MKRRDFLLAAGSTAALYGLQANPVRAGDSQSGSISRAPADTAAEPWMEGFPPPVDRVVRFSDGSYAQFPRIRWSFCHMEELVPTRTVWRGTGPVREIERSERDFTGVKVDTLDGRKLTLQQALQECHTDGLLVMHRGKILSEQYFSHCTQDTRHIINSATKSYVGTIAEELVVAGELDREKLVPHCLPELADTAWSDARVADVMDMLVGMKFDEDYSRRDSEVYRYLTSMGMLPYPPGSDLPISVYQYLPNIPKEGEHNRVFAYREPNISVLGWLVRRVTGKKLTELFEEKIWQPLGMERDAYCLIDGWGAEGSICMTLRDYGRFGDMMLNRGSVAGQQVFDSRTVENCFRGGDTAKFAAGDTAAYQTQSYRSQWWVRHLHGRNAIQARGAYGQSLYVDPKAEVVIARVGSAKTASSRTLEHLISPMHDAIVKAVSGY